MQQLLINHLIICEKNDISMYYGNSCQIDFIGRNRVSVVMNGDALNTSPFDEEKPNRTDTPLWNYQVQRVEDVRPDPEPQMLLPPLNSTPKAGLISWKVSCVFVVMSLLLLS